MIWTFMWLTGIFFFSKATSMAAHGIEVWQNDICVVLPVLTYLVSFLFHCLSQQGFLEETYRELDWQSRVYFRFSKWTVVDQIVL